MQTKPVSCPTSFTTPTDFSLLLHNVIALFIIFADSSTYVSNPIEASESGK
jgi:hypothetical protein